ncbi:MAG: IS200/IS605 family element transposase accessory protein TnpB, partial [Candidatus Sericytochromatia bacterium]|nr:IS200/IS605 family element transposase accessory protein TnpB [Candidatus Sericytochromatia bacterium]
MQTTLTATLFENQDNIQLIKNQLDRVVVEHSLIQRKLYKDIISYKLKNKIKDLSNTKINELKSSYQLNYNINSRQYNSIYLELTGKISSVLELNKGYINDTKINIKSLDKTIQTKNKALTSEIKSVEIYNKDLINKDKNCNQTKLNILENNINNLKKKLFYLNDKLIKAKNKLNRLQLIQSTGNPQLCFGSNKLFKQQFEIDKNLVNPKYKNLTPFKTFASWKQSWLESRNKSFFLVGSSDEACGNQNCQIKHIINNLYEIKLNINPKENKLNNRYIKFKIYLHNDKNNTLNNAISLKQAISFRFNKVNKVDGYKISISLDKTKQQTKMISNKSLGTIGVDINADHLAVAQTDRFGNLLEVFNLPLDLKNKTTEQSKALIGDAVKELTDYALQVNKPVVIENLDFSNKKKELKNSFNKKYNQMLSSFAYSKIIELIKSRCFDKGLEVIEVNPAYTSKIGKFKYQDLYKLTTHQAAALVIARRGLLSYSKTIQNIKGTSNEIIIENKEKKISNRRSKYYCFDLPVRNNQRKQGNYWK